MGRFVVNGICFILAFSCFVGAVWEHDLKLAGAWTSAMFGWLLATMYAWREHDE